MLVVVCQFSRDVIGYLLKKWLLGSTLSVLKETKVVFHLHGQTGRSTVWANGTKNSGLVNLILEWGLPFVQIKSIYRLTFAKAWNWCHRWLWWNGTQPPFGTSRPGKQDIFQMFRCSLYFSARTTQKVVFNLQSNWILRNFFLHCKPPKRQP